MGLLLLFFWGIATCLRSQRTMTLNWVMQRHKM